MSDISVRERLPRELLWMAALFLVWLAYRYLVGFGMVGVDSHAYWAAWRGDMYGGAPATQDAFLYSPAFAQAVWPLAQLPWPVFATVWAAAAAATLVWLVKVKDWYVAVPLFLVGTHEIISGNINWLMAAVVVLGLRHPALWAFPFLTKITPCLGPVWFLARAEWRSLAVSLSAIAVVGGVSWAAAPDLWREWLQFLADHAGSSDEQVGGAFLPPLVYRLPLVIALVVWGARTDRVWVLPVGMLLASPVAGPGQFVLMLALPRLMRQGERATRDVEATGSTVADAERVSERA